jgi:hypothetical protein
MVSKTLHIEKPSKELLQLVRNMRAKKEADKIQLTSMRDVYFSK